MAGYASGGAVGGDYGGRNGGKIPEAVWLLRCISGGPCGAASACFLSIARDLRGPGLRAYFCCAAKVGKNALRKLRFLRTFLHYGDN